MQKDFTAILEAAFRAEAASAFMPKLIFAVLTIAILAVAAWLLFRFFQKQKIRIPKNILLIFSVFYAVALLFLYSSIRDAQSVRAAAFAEIPAKAKEASVLVQHLLTDSTGTAVATTSGTYLALRGEQIFLPSPVAAALQNELVVQNLRLP